MENNFYDFQKFKEKFSTEELCRKYLEKIRWHSGFSCPKCQYNKAWKLKDNRYKCKKCGYRTSVTAGTLFQDTHFPLTLWFHAIWYVASQKKNITIRMFQNELGIKSCRPAWMLLSKLKSAKSFWEDKEKHKALMGKQFEEKLSGLIEITKGYIVFGMTKFYIVIIVEVQNKRVARVRAKEIDTYYINVQEINRFLIDNVKEGSTILNGIVGDDNKISKLYKVLEKPNHNYDFPYVHQALENMRRAASTSSIENLTAFINQYCNEVDAIYAKMKISIPNITFDDLLKMAIELQPHPFRYNIITTQ